MELLSVPNIVSIASNMLSVKYSPGLSWNKGLCPVTKLVIGCFNTKTIKLINNVVTGMLIGILNIPVNAIIENMKLMKNTYPNIPFLPNTPSSIFPFRNELTVPRI